MTQAIAANEVGEFESLSVVPRRSQPSSNPDFLRWIDLVSARLRLGSGQDPGGTGQAFGRFAGTAPLHLF